MLEPATKLHAEALAFLHRAAFPPDQHPGALWTASTMGLQLALPGAYGWIAPQGGMVLARTVVDEGEILTLAVHPEARRRGLGRALLDAARRTAAERGARAMFLEVDANNTAALALYSGAGYAPVGRRAGYYRPGADAIVLKLAISCESGDG